MQDFKTALKQFRTENAPFIREIKKSPDNGNRDRLIGLLNDFFHQEFIEFVVPFVVPMKDALYKGILQQLLKPTSMEDQERHNECFNFLCDKGLRDEYAKTALAGLVYLFEKTVPLNLRNTVQSQPAMLPVSVHPLPVSVPAKPTTMSSAYIKKGPKPKKRLMLSCCIILLILAFAVLYVVASPKNRNAPPSLADIQPEQEIPEVETVFDETEFAENPVELPVEAENKQTINQNSPVKVEEKQSAKPVVSLTPPAASSPPSAVSLVPPAASSPPSAASSAPSAVSLPPQSAPAPTPAEPVSNKSVVDTPVIEIFIDATILIDATNRNEALNLHSLNIGGQPAVSITGLNNEEILTAANGFYSNRLSLSVNRVLASPLRITIYMEEEYSTKKETVLRLKPNFVAGDRPWNQDTPVLEIRGTDFRTIAAPGWLSYEALFMVPLDVLINRIVLMVSLTDASSDASVALRKTIGFGRKPE